MRTPIAPGSAKQPERLARRIALLELGTVRRALLDEHHVRRQTVPTVCRRTWCSSRSARRTVPSSSSAIRRASRSGCLALPGAMGVRMALPDRPVVAVVGDGSSIYQIQSLWSAAHYGIGVLVVVLANGRYAI